MSSFHNTAITGDRRMATGRYVTRSVTRALNATTKKELLSLPIELLAEIFSRLPVRCLLLCKCVCKRFLTVFKSPNFIDAHVNHINSTTNNVNPKALITFIDTPDDDIDAYIPNIQYLLSVDKNTNHVLPSSDTIPFFIPITGELNIIGCCNGLLCAYITTDTTAQTFNGNLLLWNPLTRKFRYLPKPQFHCLSSLVLEFGFVPETNDYKVVRIVSDYARQFVEVYKMSTDSWVTVDYELSLGVNSTFLTRISQGVTPVFLNGAFHWGVADEKNSIYSSIMSFNLKDEEFRLMNALGNADGVRSDNVWTLVVIDESLALICWKPGLIRLQIWMMNDYGVQDSWALWCYVDDISPDDNIVSYWTNGLLVLGAETDSEVTSFLYDLHTEARQEISWGVHLHNFYKYVQTLVPVNRVNEALAEA